MGEEFQIVERHQKINAHQVVVGFDDDDKLYGSFLFFKTLCHAHFYDS